MFTGIIEATGTIINIDTLGTNRSFRIQSALASELKPDQSVAHDGVCLTVEEVMGDHYKVTAVEETLKRTTLFSWKAGQQMNLERCLLLPARLDGHLVQGHIDTTGTCISRKDIDGSWLFTFSYPNDFRELVVEKGSIAVNGISLTVFGITEEEFSVAIIPYTFTHTNLHIIEKDSIVNLEFDILGKYVKRNMEQFRKP